MTPRPSSRSVPSNTPVASTGRGGVQLTPPLSPPPPPPLPPLTPPTRRPLHRHTPLVYSPALSAAAGMPVHLKMETAQVSGSYKFRGHSNLLSVVTAAAAAKAAAAGNGDGGGGNGGGSPLHFVCSSEGNAGAAVATAAAALGVAATIYVPSTTPAYMRARLAATGAQVVVSGGVWEKADAAARAAVAAGGGATVYVSPFDDERIWEGAASWVDELVTDWPGTGLPPPRAVVVSVGGGGLLLGTARGLARAAAAVDIDRAAAAWGRVRIVATETEGAASFAATAATGGAVPVTLPAMTSIAFSLGALRVADAARALLRGDDGGSVCSGTGDCGGGIRNGGAPCGGGGVDSVVVSDRAAVEGCLALAVEQRVLVEVACGAAVAGGLAWAADHPPAAAAAIGGEGEGRGEREPGGGMVIVVCGGNMASPALLAKWVAQTGATHPDLV